MMQAGFWPQALSRLEPLPRQTAHCDGVGFTSTGQKFAVKLGNRFPMLPATEALCHELAKMCEVRVPNWTPVSWLGKMGFGSCWLDGAVDEGSAQWLRYWNGAEPGTSATFFGRCCALDGFLHNPDRHLKNFLLQQGTGVLVHPHGGDYSCAWWMAEWPPRHSLPADSRSVTIYNYLNQKRFVSLPAAADTLDRLAAIDASAVASIMATLPIGWCSDEAQDALLKWWSGPDRITRILNLKGLIQRGHLPL